MSSQQVMTNMGPRRKGSARLEPLAFSKGSPSDALADSTASLLDGRSPSAHLPPLQRGPKDLAADAFDSVLVDDVSPGVSPARRARKAALLSRSMGGDGDHRTVLQASLALDQKEREMALIRDNKREYGRILLELWVNQVLDANGSLSSTLASAQGAGVGDPLKIDASALKGLASYGLTRVELLGAGLSNEAIDRLYRCMYVYTVGFFDVMQDLLSHNEFRTEILSNVWKGFLTIAESALQVSFRSDYLKLYQSQQVAMAELLFAKEQLTEARQDSVNSEQAVAWLTNAHAEERAARQVLKSQVQELQGALERERLAHQAAVTKYVTEVEERVRLQAQLASATAKLSEAAIAHVDLIVQRDHLTSELAAAEQRALRIVDHVRGVYEALAMEKALRPNPELHASLESLLRIAANASAANQAAAAAAAAAAAGIEPSLAPLGSASGDPSSDAAPSRAAATSVNTAVQGSEPGAAAAAKALPSSSSWASAASSVGDQTSPGVEAGAEPGIGPGPSAATVGREGSTGGAAAGTSSGSRTASVRPSSTGSTASAAGRSAGSGGGGDAEGDADADSTLGAGGGGFSGNAWPLLPALDANARAEVTVLYSDLIQDMAKQIYGMWREQTESTSTAVRSLYEVRDNLRASKMREYELQVELDKTRATAQSLTRSLAGTETELRATAASLQTTEEALAALRASKSSADIQIEDLTRELAATRTDLDATAVERNSLLAAARVLQSDLEDRDQRLERLDSRLTVARDSLAEVSRAMVVYAKAASAQDGARGYFKRMYLEASKRAGDLQWSLFRTERQVRTLEGKVEHKNSELATLVANSERAKQDAEGVATSLAGAMMDIENKKAMIGSLERALANANEEAAKTRTELEETVARAEAAELQLEEARAEIERQSDSMQALEGRIAAAGEERARLLKQVERLVSEKVEVERSGKQNQNSLQAEINRRGTEIAALRADIDGLNGQIEVLTAELGHTREQLERKREKKKKWKNASAQYEQQAEFLRASLAERDGMVSELQARLEPLEVDVAVLMADRGRDAAMLKDAVDDTVGAEDQPDIDPVAEQLSWDETTHRALELSARLEAQQTNMEAARREYETARAAFCDAPTDEGRKTALLGIEAVLAKLRVERSETESDLARLRERQIAIQGRLQAWENAAFKRRIGMLQKRTGKTEEALKNELISRLDESKQRVISLQSTVDQQAATSAVAQNRAARMEIEFIKTEAEMRDLGEKLKRTVEFKVELERQVAQYKNMVGFLQAEVSSLSRERDALKTNLQEVDQRIERLTTDVSEAQSAVGITSKRLEAKYEAEKREAIAASQERQKMLEGKVAACETRIKELESLLDFANESFRRFLAATLAQREADWPPAFVWHINRPEALTTAIYACSGKSTHSSGAALRGTSRKGGAMAVRGSVSGVPVDLADGGGGGGGQRLPAPPSLGAALGKVPYSTNFDYERDTVLGFMSSCWSFDITLVTISQVYVEKLQADLRAEEGLLGGVSGPRSSFETVLYDYFTARFGCRPAAELHLAAFLAAVRRFRTQHPKVRTFGRLLGLPEPPPLAPLPVDMPVDPLAEPLPPSAIEFYMTLLNRVHARAGPLIAEAAEGFSLVKSKVLSRMAREFLRGSFNTTLDEVAATSDYIRHMALNDDEKAIDLELALEAILRAFVLQYNVDFDALCATFRSSFETSGRRLVTPDDMLVFLRQLNAEKAAAMPPMRVLGMYVEACRAAGPNSENLGKELCRVVLNSGFVGISTHVTRHEPMRSLPPYDEFELLEESWRLMRVAVEQQVAVIKSHSEQVKCDVLAYVDLARRVDELIGGRDSPVPAWTTYRRLLTSFCMNREAVDAILPFDPPIGSLSRSGRRKSHSQQPDPSVEDEAGGEGQPGEGDGEEPDSGATSRDVSPYDRRRSSRKLVSHKSLGVALARTSSSGDLGAEWALAATTNSNAITGEVRRTGKLLVPKGMEGAASSRSLAANRSRKAVVEGDHDEQEDGEDWATTGTPAAAETVPRTSASNIVKLQFNIASRKSIMLPQQ